MNLFNGSERFLKWNQASLCYVGKGMVGWCHNIDSHRLCVRNS